MSLSGIFYFLLTIAILVAVHEFGHYWVARRCGVKVLRFSIGFGLPLASWTNRDGTEFVIAAIPLGGYVRMLDEREGNVDPVEAHLAFNRQSASKRSAIVLAGPVANFMLAILVYWLVFVIGVQGVAPVIDRVDTDSPAYLAGMEAGQRIVSVDGVETSTVSRVTMQLLKRIGDTGTVELGLRYADSSIDYQSSVSVSEWLSSEQRPNPYDALGLSLVGMQIPAVIDEVDPGGPASLAGFFDGDEIIVIDGESIHSWGRAIEIIRANADRLLSVSVLRDGQTLDLQVRPREFQDNGEAVVRIGVRAQIPELPQSMRVLDRRGPVDALFKAGEETIGMIGFTLDSIKKLLAGLIAPSNLNGPVAIAKTAAYTAESGMVPFLQFLALLSVSLGVLNLLPIPVLDGGHLLFIAGEVILRRPVPEKLQIIGQQLGLFLILGIMALALYNDITHF